MLEWNAFGRGFDSRRLHHLKKDNPSLRGHSLGRGFSISLCFQRVCALLAREQANLDQIGEETVSLKPVLTDPVFI